MKSFQKILTTAALTTFFAMGANAAMALTITDVPNGYWAEQAIVDAVSNNFLTAPGGQFKPNSPISRAEFANVMYNVIQRGAGYGDAFKDVNYNAPYGQSILTLRQLQVVCGYPDGNFKPNENIKRSEASSVVANIVKTTFWDNSVLNRFKDKNQVPVWATPSYVNNIINNIYVNYPQEDVLLPNDYLTRAQAAVLAVKLKYAIENYKTSYLPKERNRGIKTVQYEERVVPIYVGTNTLGEFKPSYKNTVKLYDSRKIIEAGNIVPVRSLQRLNAKTVDEGQEVTYVSPKDIYSLEGTKLYPQGTKFLGAVEKVEKSYWLKKQHKAYIVFNKGILSDGTEFPVAGVLYSMYNGEVVLEKKQNSKKVQADAVKKYPQRDAAIKFTNKLVPVIKYEEKAKDNLYMLITGDMIIPDTNSL